jgi:hypothetical protein
MFAATLAITLTVQTAAAITCSPKRCACAISGPTVSVASTGPSFSNPAAHAAVIGGLEPAADSQNAQHQASAGPGVCLGEPGATNHGHTICAG